jgi:hypothetical protein
MRDQNDSIMELMLLLGGESSCCRLEWLIGGLELRGQGRQQVVDLAGEEPVSASG